MATLIETFMDDIKTAMKAREKDTVTTLRTIHAQIKDAGTNAGKEETDELVATVLAKAIKQRQDSVEQFKQGGRDDLVAKELREIEWPKGYQPEQMDEAAIEAIVKKAIADAGASSKQDMGGVMKLVMPQVKGRADGKLVNQTVLRLLA